MILISYLAGIVDGEGTITIQRFRNTCYPRISIANSCLLLLKKCAAAMKIPFCITSKKSYKKNHKKAYTLTWQYNHALKVAELIRPFLIVKKEQAALILKWRQVVKRNGKYSPQEKEKRNQLVCLIQKLNKRGSGPVRN